MTNRSYVSPGAFQPNSTGSSVKGRSYVSPGALQPQGLIVITMAVTSTLAMPTASVSADRGEQIVGAATAPMPVSQSAMMVGETLGITAAAIVSPTAKFNIARGETLSITVSTIAPIAQFETFRGETTTISPVLPSPAIHITMAQGTNLSITGFLSAPSADVVAGSGVALSVASVIPRPLAVIQSTLAEKTSIAATLLRPTSIVKVNLGNTIDFIQSTTANPQVSIGLMRGETISISTVVSRPSVALSTESHGYVLNITAATPTPVASTLAAEGIMLSVIGSLVRPFATASLVELQVLHRPTFTAEAWVGVTLHTADFIDPQPSMTNDLMMEARAMLSQTITAPPMCSLPIAHVNVITAPPLRHGTPVSIYAIPQVVNMVYPASSV